MKVVGYLIQSEWKVRLSKQEEISYTDTFLDKTICLKFGKFISPKDFLRIICVVFSSENY